jgi:hypothetical protein
MIKKLKKVAKAQTKGCRAIIIIIIPYLCSVVQMEKSPITTVTNLGLLMRGTKFRIPRLIF